MRITLVLLLVLMQGASAAQTITSNEQSAVSVTANSETENLRQKLESVRRICVDSFGETAAAKQIQAMVVASLAEAKRFVITENKDKADAVLRGTALETSSQEFHSNREGTIAAGANRHAGAAMGVNDSSASTETVDHARLAVRLVSADGDVIWASTQESRGAKYKGAGADVADKIVKQLLRDIEKAERPPAAAVSPAK
jgi:hypothetical protein